MHQRRGKARTLQSGHLSAAAESAEEILAYSFHRERGLPSIVVRLFNAVGPRQSVAHGMVVPRLVHEGCGASP